VVVRRYKPALERRDRNLKVHLQLFGNFKYLLGPASVVTIQEGGRN